MDGLSIRAAQRNEQSALEEVQRRTSLMPGDYRELLLANPDAIHLPHEHIERGKLLVAEIGGRIAGFAVLVSADGQAELEGLFVEPDLGRRGIGSALVEEATLEARRRGLRLITVVASLAAEGFYAARGFSVEGETQTRFGPAVLMSR